jgi:hypothetical protein
MRTSPEALSTSVVVCRVSIGAALLDGKFSGLMQRYTSHPIATAAWRRPTVPGEPD